MTYAWIVDRGVAKITNTVAPLARSLAICDANVGRLSTSYGSSPAMFDALAPETGLAEPARLSFP